MSREEAYQLVTSMLKNPNLVKHCLAVEAIMRDLAAKFGEDEEEWGLVGLLHDADYEVTNKDLDTHTDVIVEILKRDEVSERIINAILAHHPLKKPNRENLMEKAVYCADELSGLITACALVQPEKKLASVTVESVLKKFKQPSFAAGAKRDQIKACEEELNIPLEEFVEIALKAMQKSSKELGL
jgi:uncharacterized protein